MCVHSDLQTSLFCSSAVIICNLMSCEILEQHSSLNDQSFHCWLVLAILVERLILLFIGLSERCLELIVSCFLFTFQVTEQKNKGEQHCDKCAMLSRVGFV